MSARAVRVRSSAVISTACAWCVIMSCMNRTSAAVAEVREDIAGLGRGDGPRGFPRSAGLDQNRAATVERPARRGAG